MDGIRVFSSNIQNPTDRSKIKPNQWTIRKSICSVDRNILKESVFSS